MPTVRAGEEYLERRTLSQICKICMCGIPLTWADVRSHEEPKNDSSRALLSLSDHVLRKKIFSKDSIYLFMRETERGKYIEKQAVCGKSDAGLSARTPGQ